ncbi:MAG: hypothetical protein OSB57_11525, partial [Planctomycetota bacterium]|nr:hypothetical protein [Planctomycetota bacterium]
ALLAAAVPFLGPDHGVYCRSGATGSDALGGSEWDTCALEMAVPNMKGADRNRWSKLGSTRAPTRARVS